MMNTIVIMMMMCKGSNDHDDGDEHHGHDDDEQGQPGHGSSHGSGEQSQSGITLKRQLKGPNTVLLLTSELLLYKPSDGSPATFHSQSTKSKV